MTVLRQSAPAVLRELCSAADPRPVVVCATDRCAPARGGVQTYLNELIDCLSDRFRFVVLTATRDAEGLDDAVLRPGPSTIDTLTTGSGTALIVTARLASADAATYRQRREAEERSNSIEPASYYSNRWSSMNLLARLLASEVGVNHASDVVVHAMGPWEMSLTAERVFPFARRVVTPFIHPGHWGDDPDSVHWLATAEHVVALTPADQAVCESVGLPSGRTTVVPVPYARRSTASVSRPRDVVAFVGVNRPYKGVDLFVAAVESIAAKWPEIDFVALTSPTQGSEAADAPNGTGCVRWLVSLSDRERDELLGRAICIVLPSATEISPYAVLEGWDHGAAAIVSDDSHFRSLVGDGGLFVPRSAEAVATAISNVLSGRVDVPRMVEAGRAQLAEKHAPRSVSDAMTGIYGLRPT